VSPSRYLVASKDGLVRAVGTGAAEQAPVLLVGHAASVVDACTLSGDRAVTVSADGVCKIWDISGGKQLRDLRLDGKTPLAVAVTLDELQILIATTDCCILSCDVEGGDVIIATFDVPTPATSASFCHGNAVFASHGAAHLVTVVEAGIAAVSVTSPIVGSDGNGRAVLMTEQGLISRNFDGSKQSLLPELTQTDGHKLLALGASLDGMTLVASFSDAIHCYRRSGDAYSFAGCIHFSTASPPPPCVALATTVQF
jgi:WD40 repeat protein